MQQQGGMKVVITALRPRGGGRDKRTATQWPFNILQLPPREPACLPQVLEWQTILVNDPAASMWRTMSNFNTEEQVPVKEYLKYS